MKTKGFNPFLHYSSQLQTLIIKSSKQKNPALWLHQNNARKPLFMLEALTRLHDKAFGNKVFAKWNKRFKKLEDELGVLDYYFAFEKEFRTIKKIDKTILADLVNKQYQVEDRLNVRLHSKKWFEGKLLNFNVKLSDYSVLNSKEYIDSIHTAILKEIENIKDLALKLNYNFTHLEEDVHEIRRKLRWLSIYAQALNGLIQLRKSPTKIKYSKNYLSKGILSSSFNSLAKKPNTQNIIEFDANSFYALSYIIEKLGTLKDKGIKITALATTIIDIEKGTIENANKKAHTLLDLNENTESEILKVASNLVYDFIVKDKILDTLLIK